MFGLNSPIFLFFLVALSVAGVLFAAFQPALTQNQNRKKRIAQALGRRLSVDTLKGDTSGKQRRRSVEDTLREMAEKQNARAARGEQPSLTLLMRQGGLDWSVSTYWVISILLGVMTYAAFWLVIGLAPLAAAGIGAASGLMLPHVYVNSRKSRRFAQFSAEFPNAVDSIVRGVKAGMPVGDCLRVVATSAQEPVRSEFKLVIDNQTLGMPVDEAVQRLASRINLPEIRFLSIVITVQKQSGGNLTEALDNLSVVLRERKKMRGKIHSMSAEAKASAWIIGSLPVVVCFLVYLMSPDYIGLLFTTATGGAVLVACGVWMLLGVLVMRKMINFDF